MKLFFGRNLLLAPTLAALSTLTLACGELAEVDATDAPDAGGLDSGAPRRDAAPPTSAVVDSGTDAALPADADTPLTDGGASDANDANADGSVVPGADAAPPVEVPRALVAGLTHTCFAHNTVKCWGNNGVSNVLGNGTTTPFSATPVAVRDIDDALSIYAGANQSCVLRARGGLRCWGANEANQLGDGTTTIRTTPVIVPGIPDAFTLGLGRRTGFALTGSGARFWGAGEDMPLTGSLTARAPLPIVVADPAFADALQVAAGSQDACILHANGDVGCWGENLNGVLATGDTLSRTAVTPIAVLAGQVTRLFAAVGNNHRCALLRSRHLVCWGSNSLGELGDGTITDRWSPTPVADLTDVVDVALGTGHSCAVLGSGAVRCWGFNNKGQLGDGTTTDHRVPRPVADLTDAVSITAGDRHTCALRRSGEVVCWGGNTRGQLGDGTTTSRTKPTRVIGL